MTASNKNVKSVTWGATALGDCRNYRIAIEGITIEDSAAADIWISSNDLVRRRCAVQIAFGSIVTCDALALLFGDIGTLTLVTERLMTNAASNRVIYNARLSGLVQDAQHADVGAHIATFIGISGDGSTSPVV